MKEQLSKLNRIENKRIHFIDTPGHMDFYFNTMKGATQVDVAILLIDAIKFSPTMEGALTKEHIALLKTNTIKDVIVCVNKMDSIDWNQKTFDQIRELMDAYFMRENMENLNPRYVPISAFKGENLKEKIKLDWYTGDSLLGEILKLPTHNESSINKPLRLTVKNIFKGLSAKKKGMGITVKVEGGILSDKDKFLVMPSELLVSVKTIFREETKINFAISGDTVDVILNIAKEEDFDQIEKGNILCDPMHPIPLVKTFKAKIYTREMNRPIIPGSKYSIHIGLQTFQGTFKKLLQELSVENEKIKNRRPRYYNKIFRK